MPIKQIKIMSYKYLPCEAEHFEINCIRGEKSDFGSNVDCDSFDYNYEELDDENWACADNRFVPHQEIDYDILNKYGITEFEYRKIQEMLITKFCVGTCSLCV